MRSAVIMSGSTHRHSATVACRCRRCLSRWSCCRSRKSAKDLIEMKFSSAPKEAVEGEELVFRLMLHYAGKTGIEGQEIPVTIEASYSRDPDAFPSLHAPSTSLPGIKKKCRSVSVRDRRKHYRMNEKTSHSPAGSRQLRSTRKGAESPADITRAGICYPAEL